MNTTAFFYSKNEYAIHTIKTQTQHHPPKRHVTATTSGNRVQRYWTTLYSTD